MIHLITGKVIVSLHEIMTSVKMKSAMYSLQLLVSLCPTEDTEKHVKILLFKSLAQIIITERHFRSAVRAEQTIISQ